MKKGLLNHALYAEKYVPLCSFSVIDLGSNHIRQSSKFCDDNQHLIQQPSLHPAQCSGIFWGPLGLTDFVGLQVSSTGVIYNPSSRAHLATSGYICGCYNWMVLASSG